MIDSRMEDWLLCSFIFNKVTATIISLTYVKKHGYEDKQSKPAIESNDEVDNSHSNVDKCRDNIKQKVAKNTNKSKKSHARFGKQH